MSASVPKYDRPELTGIRERLKTHSTKNPKISAYVIKDKSCGAYPVEVYLCTKQHSWEREVRSGVSNTPATLERQIRRAAKRHLYGRDVWIELRDPPWYGKPCKPKDTE